MSGYEDYRRKYEEEYAIVDRVWGALGHPRYEDLNGKTIDTLVADLRAEVSRLAAEREEAKHSVHAYSQQLEASRKHHRCELAALAAENERLRRWEYPGADPSVQITEGENGLFTYAVPGRTAGPFRTWAEAYCQAQWSIEVRRVDALQAQLAAAQAEVEGLRLSLDLADKEARASVDNRLRIARERDEAEAQLAAAAATIERLRAENEKFKATAASARVTYLHPSGVYVVRGEPFVDDGHISRQQTYPTLESALAAARELEGT